LVIINIEKFILETEPHGKFNSAPPFDKFKRHEWESKLLFTIFEKLSNKCVILDFGCGSNGTLQYTLFNRYPDSIYYGLELKNNHHDNNGFIKYQKENSYLGYTDELEDILPKVDGMVLGSVFTHLSPENIIDVLNKTLPFYENGFQIGFSFFESDDIISHNKNFYDKDSYWIVTLTKKFLQDFCDKNNLTLIIHEYVQHLDHKIDLGLTYQSFATIKK
jgi:hypothetical protein